MLIKVMLALVLRTHRAAAFKQDIMQPSSNFPLTIMKNDPDWLLSALDELIGLPTGKSYILTFGL